MSGILEAFYEPDGTVIYLTDGKITGTKTLPRKHWPLIRHYYRYTANLNHPDGRHLRLHLKGDECPPLPSR